MTLSTKILEINQGLHDRLKFLEMEPTAANKRILLKAVEAQLDLYKFPTLEQELEKTAVQKLKEEYDALASCSN